MLPRPLREGEGFGDHVQGVAECSVQSAVGHMGGKSTPSISECDYIWR